MSREELGKAVFLSDSLVRSWERGQRLPKPDALLQVEKVLGLGDGEEAGILCRIRADLINDAVPLEWFGRWREAESLTTSLWTVQPLLIPGLLQTQDYATEVLRAAHRNAELHEMLAERLERQRILEQEDPPKLVALIAEAALRNTIASRETMRVQLLHLIKMAQRDNIIVQVIPADSPACAGFLSGFIIANVDGDDIAYVDNQLSGEVIEEPEEVARLRYMFDDFRAESLRARESLIFIEAIIEEMWKE
ncbi:helix-turn-helix transcriptional regulator [Actinomadura sp. NEAU-AAG7]|nr:helix-turn-helix transcriptional regulator [Actinomadura sp. NEAU-AAG7]